MDWLPLLQELADAADAEGSSAGPYPELDDNFLPGPEDAGIGDAKAEVAAKMESGKAEIEKQTADAHAATMRVRRIQFAAMVCSPIRVC